MTFYCVRALFIVLVRYPVHKPVRMPTYGLPLSQSDQIILSIFQSVHNKIDYFVHIDLHIRNASKGGMLGLYNIPDNFEGQLTLQASSIRGVP